MTLREWFLHKAIEAHLRDPRQFERGPGRSSVWGWIYFRVFAGMRGPLP